MKKRLFISINIPNEIKKELEIVQKQIDIKDIKWVSINNLHITIYFLGTIEEKLIPILIDKLNSQLSHIKRFILKFDKILFAPPNTKSRMIWAQFYKNNEYENLYKKINNVIQDIIDKSDTTNNNKELIPHITLARFNKSLPDIKIKQPKIKDLIIDSYQLMESNVVDNNRVYSTIANFKFE